ncbi:MAG: DUF3568 domain-containing protein [Lentisphaeria bacterium]|nr:DUF3568 family protein [Victivallales bacterium]MCR4572732.1 DUF3568 domain-containing protein [Lentisphaeria bacterium]
MKMMRNGLVLAVMVGLCFFGVSCVKNDAPTSANVSNEQYSWGTYRADFGTTMFLIDKAVRNACLRARLTMREHTYRGNLSLYRYHDVDGAEVKITVYELRDGGVRMKIRIGSMGDKESSQKLLLAIDDELRMLITPSTPM